MLDVPTFDLKYAGPAIQTKVPCDFYCWIRAERKYKQSSEEGTVVGNFIEQNNQNLTSPQFQQKLIFFIHACYFLITILIVFLLLQFSDNFAILLFHYDGRVTEWDEFEWSKRAIHVSVSKQTKWCGTVL